MPKKILVVGGGAREHALLWFLSQSPQRLELFAMPGNPGTAALATNAYGSVREPFFAAVWAEKHDIDLAIVGTEEALARGFVDHFDEHGVRSFGPRLVQSMLEASKRLGKDRMLAANIPTPSWQTFTDRSRAIHHVTRHALPVVVKEGGLVGGKGVTICRTRREALTAVNAAFSGGERGTVIIEAYVEGEEFSVTALCDGSDEPLLLPLAQDKKRYGDGKGPNTGGLRCFAPAFWLGVDPKEIKERFLRPLLRQFLADRQPYVGVLYLNMMLTSRGLTCLEINCRFGDPEAEALFPLLHVDGVELFEACLTPGGLSRIELGLRKEYASAVVLATEGYPTARSGSPLRIEGVDDAKAVPGVQVFHAGTQLAGRHLHTKPGRVFCVTATGISPRETYSRALTAADRIAFTGKQVDRETDHPFLR